jgi:hypothetical protein
MPITAKPIPLTGLKIVQARMLTNRKGNASKKPATRFEGRIPNINPATNIAKYACQNTAAKSPLIGKFS